MENPSSQTERDSKKWTFMWDLVFVNINQNEIITWEYNE